VKKLLLLLIFLLICVFIVTSCGGATQTTMPTTTAAATATTPATPTPKYGGTLRFVPNNSPGASIGYPPEVMANNAQWSMFVCLEGLLREKTATGELVPWLAESYKVADDLKSVTFTLRKGVKFHDGSDFNATAAKWNLDNVIAAKAEPYWTSVEVIDDYTVKVNLSKWQNILLNEFGENAPLWMVSKAAFDKNSLDWARANPVGTGPFKFVSYQRDVNLKTVKNPDYWAKDEKGNKLPYLDAVEMVYISDPVTKVSAAQSGEADMLFVTPSKTAADLSSLGFTLKMNISDTVILYPDTINKDSPWSNQLVREAAEYAIDREAIAKSFGYGFLHAPYQIAGPSLPAWNSNFTLGRHYDVEKAKQLMKEANYENGFSTTIIGGNFYNKDICAAVQAYLAKIGIIAEIKVPEVSKFASDYIFGKWNNAILYSSKQGTINYSTSMARLAPDYLGYKSWERTPEYIEAYNASISSRATDINLMRGMIETIAKQASLIPIVESGKGMAYQPYVMNSGAEEIATADWIPAQTWLNK
jgi:peptide/nickel transport system substrate-binding protein